MNNWEYIHNLISSCKSEGLSWKEIAEYINSTEGLELSSEAYRKRERRFLNKMLRNGDLSNPQDMNTLIEEKASEYSSADYMNQANAYIRRMSRENTIKDIASDFADKMSKGFPLQIKHHKKVNGDVFAEGILCISDWHYGIEINNYNNTYNTEIAKERINDLLEEVINLVNVYGIESLHVVNLGDMIAGRIHSQIKMESRIDSVTQIMEVSELIAQFLSALSEFTNVEYYEVLDNHSRVEPNLKESLELESLARITGFYLKQRLKDNHRVCINDNKYGLDIATFEVCGYKVAGVHGDKDKQKTVINSLTMYTHEFYDLILTAHLHHFSSDEYDGTIRISNGALMGTDSFAQKLRLHAKPSQTLIVSTPTDVVYAIHKIDLI